MNNDKYPCGNVYAQGAFQYIYIYVYHNGLEWVVISIGQCRYNIYIARYRYRYIHKHMDKIPYGYMV